MEFSPPPPPSRCRRKGVGGYAEEYVELPPGQDAGRQVSGSPEAWVLGLFHRRRPVHQGSRRTGHPRPTPDSAGVVRPAQRLSGQGLLGQRAPVTLSPPPPPARSRRISHQWLRSISRGQRTSRRRPPRGRGSPRPTSCPHTREESPEETAPPCESRCRRRKPHRSTID